MNFPKKFLVVTFAPIVYKNGLPYAYGPYVKEMNLWIKYATEVKFVCPEWQTEKELVTAAFHPHPHFTHHRVADFNTTTTLQLLKALWKLPRICWVIFKAMLWADHIHLRCPGNVSMLGCFIQILFPKKAKTCKYAGNWDKKSEQPWSYKLQQSIVHNPFFTRNMKVLVYGIWPDKNKNILPFYTASYSKNEIVATKPRRFDGTIRIIFVGSFMPSKGPLTTIKVCQQLLVKGHNMHLDMYGDGSEKASCMQYVQNHQLGEQVTIHGKKNAEKIKQAFQEAHFLVFISKSEGWPKVVAEAMFWGCVPITTAVSCVPEMVGGGSRGMLVTNNETKIVAAVEKFVSQPASYQQAALGAMEWSRQYTLERFEKDIALILSQTHPAFF